MASSARAILAALSCSGETATAGRFVAAARGLADLALPAMRELVFPEFFDMFSVPDRAALTGLSGACKLLKMKPK
jgi:hypothetical protein